MLVSVVYDKGIPESQTSHQVGSTVLVRHARGVDYARETYASIGQRTQKFKQVARRSMNQPHRLQYWVLVNILRKVIRQDVISYYLMLLRIKETVVRVICATKNTGN